MTTVNSLAADELGSAAQRERRKRILDATIEIASEGGYDAVQMREVAQRADVALGTLYRYFPSKVHLLVSALSGQFEKAQSALDSRPVHGGTRADRVIQVLKRITRGMQGDPYLTEALTRAFMFADKSVASEIHVVGMQLTDMLTKAMRGKEGTGSKDAAGEPTAEENTVARVISDIWLASLVAWVTGRLGAPQVAEHIEDAVRLILKD